MPPAAAPSLVSLRELVDLSIGTPEVGAVNFTALHTLLVAMLKNLNLQDTQIDFHSPLPEQSRVFESSGTAPSVPHQADPKEKPRSSSVSKTTQQMLENQVTDLGGQVQDLSKQLKTMESQVQGIVTHMQHITTQVGQPSLDIRELPVEETALLMPERMRTGSMKAVKDHKVVSATQVSTGDCSGRHSLGLPSTHGWSGALRVPKTTVERRSEEGGHGDGGGQASVRPGPMRPVLYLAGRRAAPGCHERCENPKRPAKGTGAP